ncbi:MAG: hypothetical protein QM737_02635 [Ferruginibacter sp.]
MKRIFSLLIVLLPLTLSAQIYDVLDEWHTSVSPLGVAINTAIPRYPAILPTTCKVRLETQDWGTSNAVSVDITWTVHESGDIVAAFATSNGTSTPKIILTENPNNTTNMQLLVLGEFYYSRFIIKGYSVGESSASDMFGSGGWTIEDLMSEPGEISEWVEVKYSNQFKDFLSVDGTLTASEVQSGSVESNGKFLNYNLQGGLQGNYTSYSNNHLTQNAYLNGSTWKSYGTKSSYGSAVLLQTQGSNGKAFNVLVDSSISANNETLAFTNLFTIDINGKTGIGSSNPKELLQVNGNVTTNGNNKGYRFNTYAQSGNKFLSSGYGAAMTLDSTGKFKYSNTSASGSTDGAATMNDVFVIDKDGNVGIGTSVPQAKLAINGELYAKRVKVTLTGWPDYVFEPGYKLPDLKDVEQFIKAYKHLPNVPSAQTIEKEGADVGETQKALLQKVEELTLYIIELNKKIEKLEKEKK